MRLTGEERKLLELVRAKASEGVPLAAQVKAISGLRPPRPRRKKTPDAGAAVLVDSFLMSVDYKYDILLRMQREVPRGRRTPEAIVAALRDRHPKAGEWVQNGWRYLAVHLAEHRTKALPRMTLKERAAIVTLELATHFERAPDLAVARAFIKSARERSKYAGGRFRVLGAPETWRSQREFHAANQVRELAISPLSFPWAIKRHAEALANMNRAVAPQTSQSSSPAAKA